MSAETGRGEVAPKLPVNSRFGCGVSERNSLLTISLLSLDPSPHRPEKELRPKS